MSLVKRDEENILLSLFAKKTGKGKIVTKINRTDYDDVIKHRRFAVQKKGEGIAVAVAQSHVIGITALENVVEGLREGGGHRKHRRALVNVAKTR